MSEKQGPSRGDLIGEAVVLGLIALVVGAYAWDVRSIPQKALNLMVMRPVLILAGILIVVVLGRYIAWPLVKGRVEAAAGPAEGGGALRRAAPMVLVVGMLVLYTAVFTALPFVVTTTLFMAITLVGLGNRSPLVVGSISLATAVGLYVMGERVLGVVLP